MIEVIEHTADIRLRVTARTREDLFREAVRGTIALLHPEKGERKVERDVNVVAGDPTVLLIDFLNEALSNAHAYREAYDDVVFSSLTPTHATARLVGAEAIAFGADVKAVTYHEAEVRQNANGEWCTVIVYDI